MEDKQYNPDETPRLLPDDLYKALNSPKISSQIILGSAEIAALLKVMEEAYRVPFDFMRSTTMADVGQTDAANKIRDLAVARWIEGASALQLLGNEIARQLKASEK